MSPIRSIDATHDTASALPGNFDPWLVILSVVIASVASYATLGMSERIRYATSVSVKRLWLVSGATVFGIGVWEMHFIGMLAFRLPIQVSYDTTLTVSSLLPAAFAGAVVLYAINRPGGSRMSLVWPGLLMGCGIGAMHFTGMMAMSLSATLLYDPLLFTISIIVAAVLATFAVALRTRSEDYGGWLAAGGAVVMGFAISGMHYTAMAAANFIPDPTMAYMPSGIEPDLLALGVGTGAIVILALSISVATVDARLSTARSLARTSQARMFQAIENISEGFSLFDSDDRLVICNQKYHAAVSMDGVDVRPGESFESIIRRIAKRGDITAAIGDVESWVQMRLEMHRNPKGPYIQHRSSGEWIQINERRTEDGGTVAIVTDITPLKNAEQAAQDAKSQLADSLALVEAAKARMEEELNVGRDIQMSMLPRGFPALPDRKEITLAAFLEPAKEVGGDFYDFFMVDAHHLCFSIGDVSGKGVPAALFMAMTKTMLKSRAASDRSPASIVTHVNETISADNSNTMFVTLYLGILDVRDGTLCKTNAGHNFPLLKRRGGQFEWLEDRDGPIVGPFPSIPFTESTTRLKPGDELLLYTDGVTEAENVRLELFGNDRLKTVLDQSISGSVVDCLHEVNRAVKTFAGGAPQSDDITMLGLRYNGIAPSGTEARCFVNDGEALAPPPSV